MIVEELTGNRREDDSLVASKTIHEATVDDLDLDKRVQRFTFDDGTEIGLRLPHGHRELKDGDIVFVDDASAYVLRLSPTDVIIMLPETMLDMAFVAHSLGNRHLPAQFFGPGEQVGSAEEPITIGEGKAAMIMAYDHTIIHFLDHHDVKYVRADMVMPVPFRHAEHTH